MNAPSRRSADTARPGSDEQDAPASPAPPQGEREAFLEWARTAEVGPDESWAFAAFQAGRASTQPAVPADVLAALDRMCTPLDESWLKGATAEADARCMKLIRDYVLGAAQPAVSAEARIEQPDVHSASGDLLGSYDSWRPIATAPKDGTVILLYAPSKWGMTSDAFAGCWAHGEGLQSCGIADEDYPWLAFDPGTGGLNAYMADSPTHWMALPAAPSLRSAAEAQKPNEHESGAAMGTPPADNSKDHA